MRKWIVARASVAALGGGDRHLLLESAGDIEVGKAALRRGAEVIELAYNLLHSWDLHRLAGEIMVAGAEPLLDDIEPQALIGDKAYDADVLIRPLSGDTSPP